LCVSAEPFISFMRTRVGQEYDISIAINGEGKNKNTIF